MIILTSDNNVNIFIKSENHNSSGRSFSACCPNKIHLNGY